MTFSNKNYYNSGRSRSHPIVPIVKTQDSMAPSYNLKVTFAQNNRVPFFSCLGQGV